MATTPEKSKSLESWIWDAACSIRGAKDAAKYKDYILPLIFTKRLCDVFDDELNRILASLKPTGRAAVVLDTGAASRGSGNANTNKEKDVRKWFVEQDLIEGVIYLPENLFYNTTAPGIIIVLNRARPKSRAGKMLLLNASREFVKGDPKNYLPEDAVVRIADTFLAWKEVDKYSRIVGTGEIAKNDYNISPSRYIHTGAADEYRPLAEIVEELDELEAEARETDKALRAVLEKITA